jgi:hypothetical protein
MVSSRTRERQARPDHGFREAFACVAWAFQIHEVRLIARLSYGQCWRKGELKFDRFF